MKAAAIRAFVKANTPAGYGWCEIDTDHATQLIIRYEQSKRSKPVARH